MPSDLIEAYHQLCEHIRYTHGNVWRPIQVFLAIEGVLVAATITVSSSQLWGLVFAAGLGITSFALIAEHIVSLEAGYNEENRFLLQRLLAKHFESNRDELSIIHSDIRAYKDSKGQEDLPYEVHLCRFRREISKGRRKLGVKGIGTFSFKLLAFIGFVVSCSATYLSGWSYSIALPLIGVFFILLWFNLYTGVITEYSNWAWRSFKEIFHKKIKNGKLPEGVRIMETATMKAKHTTLTEILNEISIRRLAITEPIPNFKRTMHRHSKRDDYIYLLSGDATLTVYDGKTYARIPMSQKGDVILVQKGVWHGYETGNAKVVMLEASSSPFDPNDAADFQGTEPPPVEPIASQPS